MGCEGLSHSCVVNPCTCWQDYLIVQADHTYANAPWRAQHSDRITARVERLRTGPHNHWAVLRGKCDREGVFVARLTQTFKDGRRRGLPCGAAFESFSKTFQHAPLCAQRLLLGKYLILWPCIFETKTSMRRCFLGHWQLLGFFASLYNP